MARYQTTDIRESVTQRGFHLARIKIIPNTQAHRDHPGGHALIKAVTGTPIPLSEGDSALLASGDSLSKLFYLNLRNISSKWTLTIPNWPSALSHFAIEFEDRMPNNH